MRSILFAAAFVSLGLTALAPSQAAAEDEIVLRSIEARPGVGTPLASHHPGYDIEQARPDDFLPQTGAMAFSPDGKYLAMITFNSGKTGTNLEGNGTLYLLENYDAKDTTQIIVHKVSDELLLPLGAHWLEDGLFILERDQISKWTDTDKDGKPDQKSTFASGWVSDNFHHFSFGLPYHDGFFYGTLSTSLHLSKEEKETIKPGPGIAGKVSNSKGKTLGGNAPNPEHRGCVMKVNAKTGEIEWIAGGLRTPNGPGIGPDGILLCPDNQGDWKPSNMIYVVKGGEFLGKYNSTASHVNRPDGGVPSLFHEKEPTLPAIWLPQNEIGNSPSATRLIPKGQPHAGQVLMADITQGGVHRIFMEEVDGTWQGAVFRHSMGFEAGPNDIAFGPDGCLYVGGMGAGWGNWGWELKKTGLQRLRPNGKIAFEFSKIESTKDGFRVSFTKPVPKAELANPEHWLIDAWTYVPKPFYGGPKVDNHMVRPAQIRVAADRLSAELVINDRKPNYVYHIRIDSPSDDGDKMWSPESWVTFHKAPKK